jgi:hypothetical protein
LSEEGLLKEKKAILRNYIDELRHLLDLAATARQLIAILPNSAEDLLARLDNRKSEIEKDLRKTYFFRPLPIYYFSLEGWNSAYGSTQTWIRFVPYWQIPLKETWGVFRKNLIITFTVSLVFIAAAFFLLGRTERKFSLPALKRHLFPSCIWFGFGLPLYIMIKTCGLSQFGIYAFPVEALIAGGGCYARVAYT